MKRRTFIGTSIATAAVFAARPSWSAAAEHEIKKVGLQLYTLREEMPKDFEGTIAKVGATGYKELEFAGYFNHSPKEVRAIVDKNGLTAPSTHIPYDIVENKWPETLDAAQRGAGRVVVDYEALVEKLRKGEIAALAFVAGKPAPLFRSISGEDGLHFLAIPLRPEVTAAYVPTRLTAQDYPGLVPGDQPVDTVAVGAVLAAANLQYGSERYRNLVNFVEAFFTGFQTLLEPGHHPKWREVNITADLPGWRRFPPAEEWLQRNMQAAAPPNLQDLKTIFARFIDERQQAAGGQPMSQQEKDQLFGQFELWQKSQTR